MLEQLGKYRIECVLGRGAMGTVYKAFDPHIARVVALKTIHRELLGDTQQQQQLVARFQNEAQAAGRLSHPNIVAVYDYGEDDGAAYIAMEFVEGVALSTRLQSPTHRQTGQVLGWMRQLLSALHYAHEKGVIHRDVKPGNLIITPDNQVKVTDFGIARVDTSVLTQTGSMVGTPSYMSPEQFCGALVDGRSDVFSAGIVLYQLITGERPFSGSATMVMQQILNQTPVPPSSLNPTLDRQLDAIIEKALAKRPDDRFATALQFQLALNALSEEPLAGVPQVDDDRTRLLSPVTASPEPAPIALSPADNETLDTLSPWKQQLRPQLERLLAQQVGPLARLLVKRSLAAAGDFAQVRETLLPHILSDRGREQFITATDALLADGVSPVNDALTDSQSSQGTATGNAVRADELDEPFVSAVRQRLAYLIGPIARIVVNRACKQALTRRAMLDHVAEYIQDPAQREAFLQASSVGESW